MRFTKPAVVLASALALMAPLAVKADEIKLAVATKDPVTGLDSKTWALVAKKIVDGTSVTGLPEVFMVNATTDELTVMCARWSLVGQSPYIKTNPHVLRPWTVSLVHTDGFDGYCKDGLAASSASGETYKGKLVSSDGSFSNATFVTFSPENKE